MHSRTYLIVTSQPSSDPSSQLWTTKYAPTALAQICGNKTAVEKIQLWLHDWYVAGVGIMNSTLNILEGPNLEELGLGMAESTHSTRTKHFFYMVLLGWAKLPLPISVLSLKAILQSS
jgi:hypothetical protein